jgi:hypothetical protein
MIGVGVSLKSLRSSVSANALKAYAANGIRPSGLLDYGREVYVGKAGRVTDPLDIVTYTGASASTMFDASGTLVTVPIGTPRLNSHIYENGAWVNNGLFLESEARENLQSESRPNSNWNITNATLTENQSAGLGGGITASRITGSGVTEAQRTGRNAVSTGNTVYAYWVRKGSTHGFAQILHGSDITFFQNFALSTGVLGTGGAGVVNADIVDFGDFWLIFAAFDVVSSAVSYIYLVPSASATYSQSSDTSDYIDIAHAQVEAALTPSSPIPTAGSTVTRLGQTAVIEPANNPLIVGGAMPDALSIGLKGKVTGASSTFINWTADADNGLLVQSGASDFTFTQEAATVVDTVTGGTYTSGINVPFNIASYHDITPVGINGAVDGTALTANTTPTALPDLATADFQIGPTFMGHIQELTLYAADVADTGLEEITG